MSPIRFRSLRTAALMVLLWGCAPSTPVPPLGSGRAADDDDSTTEVEDVDADGDGWLQADDCNDEDPEVHPEAEETCNGVDDNCVDGIDEGFDEDEDQWTTCAGDCDDSEFNVNPAANEICDGTDTDCDGVPMDGEIDADGDEVYLCAGDCDDEDPDTFPGAEELCDAVDNDCDEVVPAVELDSDADGFLNCAGDCNDGDPDIHPGATEICDDVDDDCNGVIVENPEDNDGDGYFTCSLVLAVIDCDDGDPAVHPGAIEICDGFDDDCDGLNEDGVDNDGETDADGDGHMICDEDCDDGDVLVFPGQVELCDEIDSDCSDGDGDTDANDETDVDLDGVLTCDGDCDDADPSVTLLRTLTWDGDGDGQGDASSTAPFITGQCQAPSSNWVELATDCVDTDATVFDGAPEICDSQANDCAGSPTQPTVLPTNEQDPDLDGVSACDGDCSIFDGANAPGNTEICDGGDNDCDPTTEFVEPSSGATESDLDGNGITDCDEANIDFDQDGETVGDGDCVDNNAAINTSATEVCNGIDDDCDAQIDEGLDNDGDGWSACLGDCDDSDAAAYPGAPELCDGIDNNCDGALGSGEVNGDADPFMVCAGDCDDTEAGVFPGQAETCNAVDDDCDGTVDNGWDNDGDGVTMCGPDGVFLTTDDDCSDTNAAASALALAYLDADGDGDGGPISLQQCGVPSGWSANTLDCDDGDPTVFDGATEQCNGVDDDCDGSVPGDESDVDNDGQRPCAGDCADLDPANLLGGSEICDGQDNNCDGLVPTAEQDIAPLDGTPDCATGTFDTDGDGYTPNTGDCLEGDAAINPGATEVCNFVDDDCDAQVDEGSDSDGDGQTTCEGDCDDTDPTVGLGFNEICDGLDNDCVSGVPSTETDGDGDGFAICDGDCDDSNGDAFPTNIESLDSVDNDCDGEIDEGLLPTVPSGLVDFTVTSTSSFGSLQLYVIAGTTNTFPPGEAAPVSGTSVTESAVLLPGVHAIRYNGLGDGIFLMTGPTPSSATIAWPGASMTIGGTPVSIDADDAVWNNLNTGTDGILLVEAVTP